MNNKELIEKIEEMDSNKDIMLEVLVEKTNKYLEYIDTGEGEKIFAPYQLINIDNKEYAIFFVKSTDEVFLNYKKSKFMEIFEIYNDKGFVAYAGRDVYKWKGDTENLYCQLEEVEPIQKTIIDWRYK